MDTIGGYLCLEAGHVPEKGEIFECGGWRFIVDEADAKQIRRDRGTRHAGRERRRMNRMRGLPAGEPSMQEKAEPNAGFRPFPFICGRLPASSARCWRLPPGSSGTVLL